MHKVVIGPSGVMHRMTDAKYHHLRMELMMKYTVKTVLNNVIQNKEGQFTYREKIVSMKWEEKAKRDAVQSGKGPGEFGPDYSDRKKYQLGHGNESPSPLLRDYLDKNAELLSSDFLSKKEVKPTGRIAQWWRDLKGKGE